MWLTPGSSAFVQLQTAPVQLRSIGDTGESWLRGAGDTTVLPTPGSFAFLKVTPREFVKTRNCSGVPQAGTGEVLR